MSYNDGKNLQVQTKIESKGYKMKHFLIDLENLSDNELNQIKGVKKSSKVIFFYSHARNKIDIDSLSNITTKASTISFIKIKKGKKNALDLQLCTHLGGLIAESDNNKKDKFIIVAKDKDYDCVVDFWHNEGINVTRLEPSGKLDKSKVKQKQKKKSNNTVSTKEIQSVLSNNEPVNEILKIINNNKTKLAISNGLSKLFKDTKKSGKVYQQLKPLLKRKK